MFCPTRTELVTATHKGPEPLKEPDLSALNSRPHDAGDELRQRKRFATVQDVKSLENFCRTHETEIPLVIYPLLVMSSLLRHD